MLEFKLQNGLVTLAKPETKLQKGPGMWSQIILESSPHQPAPHRVREAQLILLLGDRWIALKELPYDSG